MENLVQFAYAFSRCERMDSSSTNMEIQIGVVLTKTGTKFFVWSLCGHLQLKQRKNPLNQRVYVLLAEDMRFELTEACTSPPFQDGALNRSANPPTANSIIHKPKSFVITKMLIFQFTLNFSDHMSSERIFRNTHCSQRKTDDYAKTENQTQIYLCSFALKGNVRIK